MNKSPFISCLNPLHITNPYTNEPLLVSCGKCEACLAKKSASLTLKCKLESKVHKYCYFVTLTYNNDNIPLLDFDEHDGHIHFYSEDDCFALPRLDWNFGEVSRFLVKVGRLDKVPYLRKKDLQLFMKRLRKYISKYSDEKIRYFGAGEYGPVHFRPHYHLLLWFDSDIIREIIGQAISSCWKFGRIDYSLSRGQSAGYTAGYVNSTCSLPRVYRQSQTRSFAIHSQFLGETFLQTKKEEVYAMRPIEFAKRCVNFGNADTEFFVWRSLAFTYFPKCKCFSAKSYEERYYSYTIYDLVREWTQETSPWRQSRYITERIFKGGFEHFVPEYERLLQYFRKSCRIPILKELNYEQHYDTIANSIYQELRISHHFLYFVCDHKTTYEIRRKINIIDNYYKDVELYQLNEHLKVQEEYFDEYEDTEDIEHIYCNNFDVRTFKESSSFKRMQAVIMDRAEQFVKHKKLNDSNKIFNY